MNAGKRAAVVAAGVLVVASLGACSEVGNDCVRLGLCPDGRGSGGAPAGPVTTSSGGGMAGAGGVEPCTPGEPLREGGCVDDSAGVFVRTSGSDDAAGTRDAPLATLQAAMTLALAEEKVVYACAETFAERVEMPSGVQIYGGLDCDQDWVWSEGATTVLDGGALDTSAATLTVKFARDNFAVVHDMEIVAPGPQGGGESSIAVAVDRTDVRFVGSTLRAQGAAPGMAGSGSTSPAQAGSQGNDGLPKPSACTVAAPPGGAAVTSCGSTSGKGGDGGTPSTSPPGQDASDAGGSGIGAWGQGVVATTTFCPNDADGVNGEDGEPGQGATGVGAIVGATLSFTPPVASAGTAGESGTSGGGGGGYRWTGATCDPSITAPKGPSGGGGGGAGCGGSPGQGGQAGGSSVGILAYAATVEFIGSTIMTGNGGGGGNGGPGQPGGAGGTGGDGGDPVLFCHDGGDGGDGGNGGPGGGGVGGHSVGVIHDANSVLVLEGSTIMFGNPGAGGEAGSGTPAATAGDDGIAAESLEVGLL